MLNLAFCGFRHPHINSLYQQACRRPDVTVVGAFEEDMNARNAAAGNLCVNFTYSTYEELLADPKVEAVAIGDYFGIRGTRIIAALKAGKHVISDKPLCTSLKELDEIERLATEKNLKVGCMLDLRLSPWVEPVRDFIRSGKLGEVHQICFTAQHPLNWGTRPAWYFEDGKQGGTINDIAIHGIDLIPYLTGHKFAAIIGARQWNAYAKKAPNFMDSAQFLATLDNGAGVMADLSYASPNSMGFSLPNYWRFTIWGDNGVIECGYNTNPKISVALNGEASPRELTPMENDFRQVIDFFLNDLAGTPNALDTKTVFESTRAALRIQAVADATL